MLRLSANWLLVAVLTVTSTTAAEPKTYTFRQFPSPLNGPVWQQERLELGRRPGSVHIARPEPARPNRADVGPPAEFERQQAIVIAWRNDSEESCLVQLDIAREASRTVTVVVIVPPDNDIDVVSLRFADTGASLDDVIFLRLPVDSVWIRDYGPFFVRRNQGQFRLIDAAYDGVGRPADDDFPIAFARQLGLVTEQTGLGVEGGNLLTNGQGLLISTTKMVADNQHLGYSMREMQTKLLSAWNADQLIVLDPLAGEPTAHVDMFATFVDAQTVVVASIDPKADRFNSRLLDRTAKRLGEVHTSRGPLRVARIPMPPQYDASKWPSYTNVAFANGILLVPYYFEQDPTWHQAAAVYSRLLPGWKIIGIDCTDVIGMGGALHCLTWNLPDLHMVTDLPRHRPYLLSRAGNRPPAVHTAP